MPILEDILGQNLKVVFCGTAVGTKSARTGAYYAQRGNQFWEVLFQIGLTPRKLNPQEFHILPEYGIGLTDLAKTHFGTDGGIPRLAFDLKSFRSEIKKSAPKVLAFNGKRAAREFYGRSVNYGRQPELIGSTVVFVLPSTSGAARRYWSQSYWRELADFVRK